jgi:hypothetical protein
LLKNLVSLNEEEFRQALQGVIVIKDGGKSKSEATSRADVILAAQLLFEAIRASNGEPVLVRNISHHGICSPATFDYVLEDLVNANLLFTLRQGPDKFVMFHDPRQLRTFEGLVPTPVLPLPDPFALQLLPDTAKMEEVLHMVAKERDYSEVEVTEVLAILHGKWVRTVGDLRVLSEERIEALDLPPVVTEYLLRVKAGGDQ